MRILVTGAAGYIGSALVKALAGHEVVATDQSAPAPIIGNIAYPQFARSLVTAEVGLLKVTFPGPASLVQVMVSG